MREFRFSLWIGLLVCAVTDAAIVTTPAGLQPGDQYQLVFVTADTFDATSTDISTYNAEVAAEAALNPELAAFDALNGVTWTVIGSTETVNANVNAPSTGDVYDLNGIQIASVSQSLYSDACPPSVHICPSPGLLAPIDTTQWGTPLATLYDYVWSGSLSSGVAAGSPSEGYDWSYLGIGSNGDPSSDVTQGCSTLTSSLWLDCNYTPESGSFSLYALSSPIIVASPDPGTFGMIVMGLVFLARVLRKRRMRLNPIREI